MAGRRGACLTHPLLTSSIRATMLPSKSHLIGSRPMSGARALARPSAVAASAFGSNIGTRETGGRRTQTRRFPSSSVVHADSGCPPRDGPRLTTPTTPTTPATLATLGWTDGRMDGWTDGRMDGWMKGEVSDAQSVCSRPARRMTGPCRPCSGCPGHIAADPTSGNAIFGSSWALAPERRR